MSDLPITVTDGLILLVVLLSAILAFARGFVHEVLSVAAWIGAIAAVVFLLPYARPAALQIAGDPLIADIGAGAIIFVVTLVVLSLLTRIFTKTIQNSALNAVDRSLGFIFGLARGAIIICLAYIAFSWLIPSDSQPPWVTQAKALPLVQRGADWIKNLVETHSDKDIVSDPARDHLRKVLETEKLVRDMMSPEPKTSENAQEQGHTGYGNRERQNLERLLGDDRK